MHTEKEKLIPSPRELSKKFKPMQLEERIGALFDYFDEEEVLFTSSFGIHSAVLLHLIHRVRPALQVHFINTNFHFQETLAYKAKLTRLLDLKVVEVTPTREIHKWTTKKRLWEKYPDACCYLNKVMPLKPVKERYKVWISGLMAHQTSCRAGLQIFEGAKPGEKIWRFHPLIDMTEAEHQRYLQRHQLPAHPLGSKGYNSVGCLHCTVKDTGRNGRWKGRAKKECGLH